MVALCLLQILCTSFIQKWNFPQGIDWGAGRIVTSDTDRDGHFEFIFTTYGDMPTARIYFYELHLPDSWEVDTVSLPGGDLLWDSGHFDGDGLCDLAVQFHIESPSLADGIMIYESPDSFSYPTQEVWRDTVGFALVQPISAYDVDNDGVSELLDNNGNGQPHYFWIFESIADNLYDTVFTANPDTTLLDAPVSTHAFGDFDEDGKIEFAMGGMSAGAYGATYWIYESPANNTYEKTAQGYVQTKNIRDCFSIPDADGDGKFEFVVKGFVIPSAETHAFIFEATGDNTYEIIQTLTLAGGDYYGGYSDAGDVDGDGIPEIALEACQNIYIIKAACNDSFYVWETLAGNNSGSSVRVFDIDGNGLSEVIISGNNQTRIYEYQVGISELVTTGVQHVQFELSPNPFKNRLSIVLQNQEKCESEIGIYNVTGRLVKQYCQSISTQQYRISWDGRDNFGRQLPSGVYFVHLETVDCSETKKVVLLN